MTRRRNTINIYDYPEHLNPFRDDVDDNSEKFNTTGRRRSSFRVNAWAMFSPTKGKSKTSEDINPPSQSTTSRFMTWTPKLLRRSFRRSSPPSRSSPSQEPTSPSSSRLSFRSPNSRSSLPPSGSSRTSLQSSSSRSMLPPPSSSHLHTLPPRRPTSPPSRPAPPNIRPSLSPSRPQIVTPSTENHNNADTETTPVPPRRKALYTAGSPGKTAGELPPEDEVKYVQQGAKPKKKRRAPLPPQSPASKTGDDRQVNSIESDASLTPSITSNSVEEPSSQSPSVAATPDPEEYQQQSETLPKIEIESETPEREEKDNSKAEDKISSDGLVSEQHLQNEITEQPSNKDENVPDSEEVNNEELKTDEDKSIVNTDIEKQVEEKEEIPVNRTDEYLKVDFDVVLHISEEDLREDKEQHIENNGLIRSESDENHNVEHIKENGTLKSEDCVKNNLDVREQENKTGLHNGDSVERENYVLQCETKLKPELTKRSPTKTPEPKPRTVLPNSIKD